MAECKCDLRTRLVGDGCATCNQELAAEIAEENEREQFEKWVSDSGRGHLLERDGRHLWYKDLTVTAWWTAWQARAALDSSTNAGDKE